MILNISNHKSTVIHNGVYFFELTDYPNITDDQLKTVVEFIRYEKSYGRQTEIVCEDEILVIINDALAQPEVVDDILLSDEFVFVYHATGSRAAQQILSGGKLLSAVKVYGKTGEELSAERRDTPWCDPADYFEHIMFCWGDNPTGDYVVLSENMPGEDDLAKGNFNPGVRLYFRYNDIIRHPGHVFDGYHAVKVKDEIVLDDYLHACIVPEQYKDEIENCVPSELAARVHYVSQKGIGILDWNEKVYDFVSKL